MGNENVIVEYELQIEKQQRAEVKGFILAFCSSIYF